MPKKDNFEVYEIYQENLIQEKNEPIILKLVVEGKEIIGLVDNGSSTEIISNSLVESFGFETANLGTPTNLIVADGKKNFNSINLANLRQK
ncbi:hypothetical protein AYI70_g813 [Smittium culicis]|uniref:Uncharacterized protein n=1 Tax=Smittium culicis TaxID=133412 RepID=A0A1R1YFA3_9FUNG|nr:hypothetical protein AYI70_g813 [Smittium culicis]